VKSYPWHTAAEASAQAHGRSHCSNPQRVVKSSERRPTVSVRRVHHAAERGFQSATAPQSLVLVEL
jgi:hypothetical protein